MPPKRTPEQIANNAALSASAQAQQDVILAGIENYELPASTITRIAKTAMPEGSKMSKDTVTALTKASTVFINYLSATAHDIAKSNGLKTINAADVLKAMEMIELGDLVPQLEQDLTAFRENGKKPRTRESQPRKRTAAVPKDGNAYKGKTKAASAQSLTAASTTPAVVVSAPATDESSAHAGELARDGDHPMLDATDDADRRGASSRDDAESEGTDQNWYTDEAEDEANDDLDEDVEGDVEDDLMADAREDAS
ncbi:hypothetical protein FRB99_004868 [Tulasnella sp. 403]|nr:hypothetical protein FRB99_004868 [Tulasnella sp. 403]